MRKITMTTAALGAFCFGSAVHAMPATAPSPAASLSPTLVAEGCGPRFHRGPEGRCFPNEEVVPPRRVCPRGMHLGPEGRECRPNR